jgi:hypothetical protein
MNTKLISAVAGVFLLAGSGMALADSGKDRGRHDRHGWQERGGQGRHWNDRGWDRPRGHAYGHQKHWGKQHHSPHYYPRWHAPRPHHGHPGYHRNWGHHYGHDDGVTIIFKGRIN